MEGMDGQRCASCGVEWGRHLGIAATCARLADAHDENDELVRLIRLATVEIDALKAVTELQAFIDARPKGRRKA